MKWDYDIGAMKLEWTLRDDLVENLPLNPETNHKPTPAEVKSLAEFETFLMLANRYKMAVLDEQTVSYIIMNYDQEKEKILTTFKDLAASMAERFHGNTSTIDSEEQPQSADNTN